MTKKRLLDGPVLITGGAGFIGTNLADHLLKQGRDVLILDNLSRNGTARNLEWLRSEHGGNLRAKVEDVRDRDALREAAGEASFVFHLAAQVAVTSSLIDPIHDFDVNARGTLGLLEEMRKLDEPPGMLFTSTNKVYGALDQVPLHAHWNRYEPDDVAIARNGINERHTLNFHSPYGCSKGTADQYVLDYARSYGLPAAVFRMSCIYGPHQHGTEDQGWLSHFLNRAIQQEPITVYGDGKQVRDVLFVDDLVDAFILAMDNIHRIAGCAFNIGGGPKNTLSLLELMRLIRHHCGYTPQAEYEGWRPGDQRYYVSDISLFRSVTKWEPRTGVQEGVERLYRWCAESARAESVPV